MPVLKFVPNAFLTERSGLFLLLYRIYLLINLNIIFYMVKVSHGWFLVWFHLADFFFFLINLRIYFWLRWVFVAACGLSLVAVSGGYSSLRCMGFSLRWLLLLRSTGSRRAGSVVVTCRL